MNEKWTLQEKNFLRELSKTTTDEEIYHIFKGKFTKAAITKQRQRLKVKKSDGGRPKKG